MDFEKLVEVYEELEKTSSGNALRKILADFLKTVPKEDIAIISYLTLGRIASEYEEVNLGMAEKSVLKSISIASGVSADRSAAIMKETGDAGLTAERLLQKKLQTLVPLGKLTIHELFEKLHAIVLATGAGSQEKKTSILATLLQKSSPKGAKYIARIVLGALRMGVGDMTVLDALAMAFTNEKKNKEIIEKTYNICPDVGIIAEVIAKYGLNGLKKIDIRVGRPIKMMLAQRIDKLEEISKKIPGKVAVEGKYDGERVQVHKDKKGKISLFSRRLENITLQFPDLVKAIEKGIDTKEFIVEGEIIAVDKDGRPLPFQLLMQRRRKYDVEEFVQKIPIQLKVFDLLFLNGHPFLHQPYPSRMERLEKIVSKSKWLDIADRIITDDIKVMNKFFHAMLKNGLEGVMIKSCTADSEYQAGMRGGNWIKWKKEYVEEMADTFDLAIVGAFFGRGKRSGTYGALLCASYNEQSDLFETVCKLGTGLTDETLKELPEKLNKYKIDKKTARLNVKKEMEPDVWFEPKIVVEVLAAEITRSPHHTCSSGLALRFPRFVRFREEKTAEQATTSREIEQMFRKK